MTSSCPVRKALEILCLQLLCQRARNMEGLCKQSTRNSSAEISFFYFIKSSRTFEKNLFKYLSIHPDTCEIQHRITVATDSSLHRQIGSYSTRDKGTDTRDGVNMVTKVLKSAFPNCSMCGMQTLYRIRHRATSRKYMLLSDAAFHVPAVPTGRVCLFHVLTVEADLTCVHTTV